MGVMAYPLRYALADLALALSRASQDASTVRATAAQAAADMLGDGAGVQLLRDDGRYDSITFHHPDDELTRPYTRLLDRDGELPDDEFSTGLAASRRPVVLAGENQEPLSELPGRGTRRTWTRAATGPRCTPPCCAR
jgi:two-component system cell cycle sensor histidine kinase/response regulator CckA